MSRHGPRVLQRVSETSDARQAYTDQRQQIYPQTYANPVPSTSSVVASNYYKAREVDAKAQWREYTTQKSILKDRSNQRYVADVSQVDRSLQRELRGIEPQHHAQLVEVSLNASASALRHGEARETFLTTHPYAYKTLPGKNEHVGYANLAYRTADHIHRLSSGHATLAKMDSDRGGRVSPRSDPFASRSERYNIQEIRPRSRSPYPQEELRPRSRPRYPEDDLRSRPRSRHEDYNVQVIQPRSRSRYAESEPQPRLQPRGSGELRPRSRSCYSDDIDIVTIAPRR